MHDQAIKWTGEKWSVMYSGDGVAFNGSAGFTCRPWGSEEPVPVEILALIADAPALAAEVAELRARNERLTDALLECLLVIRGAAIRNAIDSGAHGDHAIDFADNLHCVKVANAALEVSP